MTVTVAQVVTLLNGSVVNGTVYLIFGHEVTSASIAQQLNNVIAFYNEYFPSATLTAKPALVDQIVLYETALRLLASQIMGVLMVSGFSYSTLELNVNKGNFPDIIKNQIQQLRIEVNRLKHLLSDYGNSYASMDLGEDYWDGLDSYNSDYVPQ